MLSGPALSKDAACAAPCAAQPLEALRGFSLMLLFAFPSPSASGFDIRMTAASSIASTFTVHISFYFPVSFLLALLPIGCTDGFASEVSRISDH